MERQAPPPFSPISAISLLHVIYTGVEHLHISIESAWANLEEALNHIVVQIGRGVNPREK